MTRNRPLTSRQIDVLDVVDSVGPVTASEVGDYHLPIGQTSARSALNSLERRGLVAAVYTGYGKRGRAYQTTAEGERVMSEGVPSDAIRGAGEGGSDGGGA